MKIRGKKSIKINKKNEYNSFLAGRGADIKFSTLIPSSLYKTAFRSWFLTSKMISPHFFQKLIIINRII